MSTKIAIIRCEKNVDRCPLTGCFRSLDNGKEGFTGYDGQELAGVFTCHCPGDDLVNKAKILKAKSAEVIHFCTCLFANKKEDGWTMKDGGFCDSCDDLIKKVSREAGIPCVKGTAHLPADYKPETFSAAR